MNVYPNKSPARYFAYLFALLLVLSPGVSNAIDETEPLVLLVETLESTDDAAVRSALMQGMLRGLEGRRNVAAPKGWSELSAKLANSEDKHVRDLSTQLSQIFGDEEAMQRALDVLKDTSAKPNARRKSLHSLLTQQSMEASSLLESLLDEPALQLDAIRGYAIVENPTAPSVLLERYGKMSPELRRAIIETLATRKSYAEQLLSAVKREAVSRDDIPVHVARSLNSMLGKRFASVYGEVKSVGEDREKLIAKYKELANEQAIADANTSRGRSVFKKTCASCHILYDDGAQIGPDLTGSNRANLDYILLNSVDPSYDVPEGYRMVSITTLDGLVVNGIVAEEDGVRVVLKTAENPRLVIAKEDVDERFVVPQSLMPEGQLDKMKTQEVIDLIKYLRTTEQVEMAK